VNFILQFSIISQKYTDILWDALKFFWIPHTLLTDNDYSLETDNLMSVTRLAAGSNVPDVRIQMWATRAPVNIAVSAHSNN